MSTETPWTDDMIAEARRHYDAGLSAAAIARDMGLSKGAIHGKMFRLGWQRSKTIETTIWNDDLVATMRQLFDLGFGERVIAKRIGASLGAVSGKIQRLGWERGGRPKPAPEPRTQAPRRPTAPPPPKPASARIVVPLRETPCQWPTWTMKDDVYWAQIAAGRSPVCGEPTVVRRDDAGQPVRCQYCYEHCALAFRERALRNGLRAV